MTTRTTPDRLLTAVEVANLLGLTYETVHRLHRAGRLPRGIRVGLRCLRWRLSDIERYLDRRVVEVPEPRASTR